jgi:hypothetical protein
MVLLQINILSDLSLIIKIGLVGGVKLACNFFYIHDYICI